MKWFRLHANLLNNPKFQRLPEHLKAHLVNIWCAAAQNDGVIPGIEDLAFLLRVGTDEALQAVQALQAANFIDQTQRGLQPHDWDVHQCVSDSSTGRVKALRERRKRNGGETLHVTPPRNGEVTAQRKVEERKSKSKAEQSLSGESETDISDHDEIHSSQVSNGLAEFLAAYPKRTKQRAAARAYASAIHDANEDQELMAGLRRWLASDQWVRSIEHDGARFVPDPDKFILEALYKDHPSAAPELKASNPIREFLEN